jgi:protein FAM32A
MPGEFVGGALNFKGDKSKIKKKKRRVKHEITTQETAEVFQETTTNTATSNTGSIEDAIHQDDGLTEVERKALRRRLERERLDAEKIAQKSHRERIEEFNSKLASQTELNDIPRVSAAGNG